MIFLIFFYVIFGINEDYKSNLNSKEEEKVLNALNYCKFNPSKELFEDVFNLTRSENLKIRYNAIIALSFFGDKSIIEKLKDFSKSSEPAEKISFLIAFLNLKAGEHFEIVKDLIDDLDERIKIYAKAIHTIYGGKDFKDEIKNYLYSKNIGEAYASAISLCFIADFNYIKYVLELLKSPMDEYRDVAAQAIFYCQYSKDLIKDLFDAIDKETYHYVLQNLIYSAIYQGKKDISYFTDLLISSKKRVEITKKILQTDGDFLLVEISKVLNKEREKIKEITEILEVFKSEKAIKLLRKIAFNDKISGDKRYLAVRALGKKNDMESIKSLRKLLDDKSEYLRASSIYSLGLLKDLESKNKIVKSLKDESSRVRQAVLFYIRELNLKEEISRVEELLKDPDVSVRQMANQVLKKLKENEEVK